MRRMKHRTVAASAAALAAVFAVSAIQPAAAQERKSIRWSTSNVNSYGYKVAASMTKILEEALGKDYTVTVQPYPSTTGAMKAAMDGNGEIGYTADVGMYELYAGEGGFKGYTAGKGRLVHTWYAYPIESFMAAPAAKARRVQVLEGFQRQAGLLHDRRLHELAELPAHLQGPWLRLQARRRSIPRRKPTRCSPAPSPEPSPTRPRAARSPSYWKETEIRTDVKMINPCPDEVAKLKAAGLVIEEVDPKNAFSKDVGVQKIYGVPILFALQRHAPTCRRTSSTRCSSAFYKNRDALAKADPGFTPMAKDFVGMQVNGIAADPEIPVHAGLARFLKEHKAWNDKWKIATSSS